MFGSGTAFGAGTGFGGFTGVGSSPAAAAAPAPKADAGDAADGDEEADPEAECSAEFKPLVQLEEVETSTGEEDEECMVDLKCKLYRFDNNGNEWKERGIGQVKLLKHKANQRVRLLMRQEKTLKIRANHIGEPRRARSPSTARLLAGWGGCVLGAWWRRYACSHRCVQLAWQLAPAMQTPFPGPQPTNAPANRPQPPPPLVMPGTKLQEHAGSDKAWVWSTVDFSEGEQKVELFCVRFGSPESEWPLLVERRLASSLHNPQQLALTPTPQHTPPSPHPPHTPQPPPTDPITPPPLPNLQRPRSSRPSTRRPRPPTPRRSRGARRPPPPRATQRRTPTPMRWRTRWPPRRASRTRRTGRRRRRSDAAVGAFLEHSRALRAPQSLWLDPSIELRASDTRLAEFYVFTFMGNGGYFSKLLSLIARGKAAEQRRQAGCVVLRLVCATLPPLRAAVVSVAAACRRC